MVNVAWAALATLLLAISCVIMLFAWYFHLRFTDQWGMPKAILVSWLIAGAEYLVMIPANRIGAQKGGLSPAQLRAIAEIAILGAFVGFQKLVLGRPLLWNHVLGFGLVLLGVLIVLGGPFTSHVLDGEDGGEGDARRMLGRAVGRAEDVAEEWTPELDRSSSQQELGLERGGARVSEPVRAL